VRFVAEYLVDLNATQAAIRAGYSPKTAEQISYQMLQKTSVQHEIQKRKEKIQDKLEISQEKVIRELAAVAFANASDFAKVDGYGLVSIFPTGEVDKEKLPALSSIKSGQNGVEIKLHDKVKALQLLGDHLGLFASKVELSGKVDTGSGILDGILKQLEGDIKRP
jgi:phage terminase small subunit